MKRMRMTRKPKPQLIPGLLPKEEFVRLVQRERARTDRSGREFALVLLDAFRADRETVRSACRILRSRLRFTDDVGWFDDSRIGILLPETNPSGAVRFARDLHRRLIGAGCDLQNGVFAYSGRCNDVLAPVDEGGCPAVSPSVARATSTPFEETDSVQDLQPLLVAPLPRWKRIMDVVVASVMLVCLSWLFLIVAILIKLTSRGPVIFKQLRAGAGGKPFVFYKFRSMYRDADQQKEQLRPQNEAEGPVFKMENDPRITPLGRFLRKSSIDELPQLWNVLKGDMTLVGPRPPTLDEVPKYDPWQRRRLDLTGGLTCIWQVSGRCEIPFKEWVRMDVRYSQNRTLKTDIMLLFKTIGAVLSRRGAK